MTQDERSEGGHLWLLNHRTGHDLCLKAGLTNCIGYVHYASRAYAPRAIGQLYNEIRNSR